MVQWLRLGASTAVGVQVRSLVRELRSHMLRSMAKKKKRKIFFLAKAVFPKQEVTNMLGEEGESKIVYKNFF